MPVSYFDLQDLADKTCLSLPSAEKELFHNIMLHSLFSIKNKLARHLAFKGGTCLYKCYGLPRFSEDLDFDIAVSRSMKKKIKALFQVQMIDTLRDRFGIGNLRFRIDENPTGFNIHANIRGPAFSQTHLDCHIKLDLSCRKKPIYDVKEVKYDASLFLEKYGVGGIIPLKIVDPREIFAEKVVTILDKRFVHHQRDEARDLLDLWYLLLKGHSCKTSDIRRKLPDGREHVFTRDNFHDSIYETAKQAEWNMMTSQLVIRPKLTEAGLTLEDIRFEKVGQEVMDGICAQHFDGG